MDIKMSELIEAFSARFNYAQKKIELNEGKKFEQRWVDSRNHARDVLNWCHENDRPGMKIYLWADEEKPAAVTLYPPVESQDELVKATADLPFYEEPLDAAEEADRSEEVEIADATENAEEAEAEKPLPSIPYVYVQQDCQEHLTEGCPAHFIFSAELRKAAREAIEDARREQCTPSLLEGLPVERLAAALITAACVGLSVSSNGHMKAINAAGFERLFDDGPYDEVLATIKCIRDGEGKELELTRGAMFDSFYGRAAEYYGVATLEMRRLVVTHVQGLRCPDTYPNYIQAVVLPCLDCGGRDTAYVVNKAPNSFNEAKCLDEECRSSCTFKRPMVEFARRRMAQAYQLEETEML